MIALSQMLAAGALASLVAFGGGYLVGRGDGRDIEVAAQSRADRVEEAAEQKLQAERDRQTRENRHGEISRQGAVREIYRETQKIVDRPVYRNVCFDGDGVRLLDQGVENANGENRPVAADSPAKIHENSSQF